MAILYGSDLENVCFLVCVSCICGSFAEADRLQSGRNTYALGGPITIIAAKIRIFVSYI